MANAKKRCRACKKYKPTEDMVNINGGYFCSIDEAAKHANKPSSKAKGKKIKHAAQKKNFKLSDRKTRKAALKKACHAYIRERDKDNPCICCGEPLGKSFHAGHWLESGNNPKVRYDEDNIHGQRIYCNTYKGGDSGSYEKNLRARIGDERVDHLLSLKGGIDTMTTDEMMALEKHYKQKLKDLLQ